MKKPPEQMHSLADMLKWWQENSPLTATGTTITTAGPLGMTVDYPIPTPDPELTALAQQEEEHLSPEAREVLKKLDEHQKEWIAAARASFWKDGTGAPDPDIKYPMAPGEIFILDKTKHKLIYRQETEDILEIEVVEK